MKGKFLGIFTNLLLIAVVVAVSVVGFFGGNAVTVSKDNTNLFYEAENGNGVSLMFNVYEHTDNVYKILDALDEYEAKSTFFIGGSWADDNVECLKEIASRGHEIGSHGYFHRDHNKLDYSANYQEIKTSIDFIEKASGISATLFAPPSGAYNDDTVKAARELGLKTVMWSKDTIDWRDKDASVCFTRATKNIAGGDLVLMHPMAHTLEALPSVLKDYRDKGLKTVTVSENIM